MPCQAPLPDIFGYSEVASPPRIFRLPKVRISITIEEKLADEIEKHYRTMLKRALDQNAEHLPKLANLYEELVREAWDRRKRK